MGEIHELFVFSFLWFGLPGRLLKREIERERDSLSLFELDVQFRSCGGSCFLFFVSESGAHMRYSFFFQDVIDLSLLLPVFIAISVCCCYYHVVVRILLIFVIDRLGLSPYFSCSGYALFGCYGARLFSCFLLPQ